MPATTSPLGESQLPRFVDSTFHCASRRCSGIARTSVSWSVVSISLIVERSSVFRSELDGAIRDLRVREHSHARGQDVVLPDGHALAENRAAADDGAIADARAGRDDAIGQDAAGADLGALQ